MKIYLRFTRNEEKEKCCEPLSPQLDPLETVYSPLLYQICFKASHLGDNQLESCVRLFVPWDLRSVCAFYVFGRRRSHKKILVLFSLDCPLVEAWDEQRRRPKALCECAKVRREPLMWISYYAQGEMQSQKFESGENNPSLKLEFIAFCDLSLSVRSPVLDPIPSFVTKWAWVVSKLMVKVNVNVDPPVEVV